MSAKKPAPKKVAKRKKTAKAVKNSKTTRSKTGYSLAQRKAFQAASKKAIKNAQLKHNSKVLQQRRLQAAAKAHAKLHAKGLELQAARIKKHAVQASYNQTVYANQNRSLRLSAAARLFKAQSVETNRQFAYSGEAIHARTTTLQTLTDAQAMAKEKALSSRARSSLHGKIHQKKPVATHTRKAKTSRSPYRATGNAAGRAAAAKIPYVKAKRRTAPGGKLITGTQWITAGNDQDAETCVLAAVANHLLFHTGYRVPDRALQYLGMYNSELISKVLHRIDYSEVWKPVYPSEYGMVAPEDAQPGMVVGFAVEVNGKTADHCGVLVDDRRVISWGEIVTLETEIEEAWEISWQI